MVADGILSNAIYIHPKVYDTTNVQNLPPTPSRLATQTLWVLIHLSSIIAGLGGVSPSGGGGVKELQRTFHYSVDILCGQTQISAARPENSTLPAFVTDICITASGSTDRTSVVLNIVEFLVPTLLGTEEGRRVMERDVWNLCRP